MNHDMYRFKRSLIDKLNKKAQEERDNYAMEETEISFGWFFWGVMILLALYVMFGPRP